MIPLAIDFDGTAWPFLDAFGSVPETPCHADGARVDHTNCLYWDVLPELFGATRPGEPDFFDKDALGRMLAAMDVARSLPNLRLFGLFADFAAAIAALRADGYAPVILSDVSETSGAAVRGYLDELGLDLEVVRCSGKDKAQWCLDNGSPLLVDDAPLTIADAAAKGVPLLSFPYLYNAELLSETGATVVPDAGNWQQMLAAIRAELADQQLCISA
jgi:hypothetical protein